MPCACIIFDDRGKIEFVNSFLCTSLGYDEDELLNQKIDLILTFSSRLFYQTHFFPLLRLNGKVNEIFMMLRSKNGQSVPVMINCVREGEDPNATNLGVCITVWERQKYETELIESRKVLQKALQDNEVLNALKNELEEHQQKLDRQIAVLIQRNQEYVQLNKVLSHDFQEPIRKIGIYTDILQHSGEVGSEKELKAYYHKIQDLVQRLRALTNCLQQFVNVESDEAPAVALRLNQLLEVAKKKAVEATSFDDFELIANELPQVEGRASQLQMLFSELIRNAIQNRKESTRLKIGVHATIVEENSYHFSQGKYRYTDHVRLEITDNGLGFDNQYNTYVFGLFNMLNPKAESMNMGMGLALCKQIVSNHYGTIQVQSQEGIGSTFIITLPLYQTGRK